MIWKFKSESVYFFHSNIQAYSALKTFVLWSPIQTHGFNRNSVGKRRVLKSEWTVNFTLKSTCTSSYHFGGQKQRTPLHAPSPDSKQQMQMSFLHAFSVLCVFASERENEKIERYRSHNYLPGALLLNMLRLKTSTITLTSFPLFTLKSKLPK